MEHFNSPTHRCPFCGGYDNRGLGDARCWGYRDAEKVYCTNVRANSGSSTVPGGDTYRHWYGNGECKTCQHTHADTTPFYSSNPILLSVSPEVSPTEPDVEVGSWDYLDEAGNFVTRVARYQQSDGHKTYRQYHRNEKGQLVGGMGHIPHLLYRLPELLALEKATPISVVEGEKAADACWAVGLPATCNIGGTGKGWHEDYNHWLAPHPVIVVPDNDPDFDDNGKPHRKGQKHAAAVAASLIACGKSSVKLLAPLPGVCEKGDTYDFFNTMKFTVQDFANFAKGFEYKRPRKYFYTLAELDLLPDTRWLLEDIFAEESIAMVLGESEVGKTFITLHFALRVAVETERQVVYIGIEAISQYKERIKAWLAYYGHKAENIKNFLLFDFPLQLMEPSNTDSLIELIAQAGFKPAMIVVDTYHAATEGAEENSAKDTGVILANLRRLRNAYKCCVCVLHHLNAAGIRERGSSALRAGIDTVVALKTDNDGVKVECTKQRSAAHFKTRFINWAYVSNPVNSQWPNSRVASESNEGARVDYSRTGKHDIRVLQALGGELYRAGGMLFAELQDALVDIPKASMSDAIKKCQKAGWIGSGGGRGAVYKITNDGLTMAGLTSGPIEDY